MLRGREHLHGPKAELQVDVLTVLAPGPATDAEDVSGPGVRIERDEISRARPKEALPGQEVLHLIRFMVTNAKVIQRDVYECRLGMMNIDGDRAKNEAIFGRGRLAVEENVVILRVVEAKVCVLVKRPVLLSDEIQLGDVFLDVSRRIPIAPLELVFLGFAILLLARDRYALTKLESAVDPIDRRERGCENRADKERRTPARLQEVPAKYPACSQKSSHGRNPSFPFV